MVPTAPFYVWTKAKTEKFSVFKNGWMRVDEHTFYNQNKVSREVALPKGKLKLLLRHSESFMLL